MEYNTLSWTCFFTLGALIQGLVAVELNMNSVQGTLGGVAEITCSYSLTDDEALIYVSIGFDAPNTEIVKFIPSSTFWGTVAEDFKNRANFSRTAITNGETVNVIIKETLCVDIRTFYCYLSYGKGSSALDERRTVDLSLTALPEKPSLIYNPQYLKNPTDVTFTCSAGLGRPASNFKWRLYRAYDDTWSDLTNGVTSQIDDSPAPQNCLKQGTSQVTLTFTKLDNMNKVTCIVENGALAGGVADYYNETGRLSVDYAVDTISVSTTPNANNQQSYEEGTPRVTLTCSAEGNPQPQYTWRYRKSSGLDFIELGSGRDYSLDNLDINHTGDYQCFATNLVDGVAYNVSKDININIVPTTTPKPTTTPLTTEVNTDGVTGEWKPKDDDSTTTIIIVVVVCLVAAIIAIIIIVICCIKRKNNNKETRIEEPPLKPRNNQDLNFKNKQEYYGQPDLVTTDSLKKPYNKDYNINDDALNYADMKFDDKPRSRRPVQIVDTPDYSEIAMPRV